jgi:hypothetical protein
MNTVLVNFLNNYTIIFYCIAIALGIAFIPLAYDEDDNERSWTSLRRRQRFNPVLRYLFMISLPAYGLYALYATISPAITYYDYFSARILFFTTIFVCMAGWGIALFIQIARKPTITFPALILFFIITIFPLGIPWLPDSKQDVQALIEGPLESKGTVNQLNRTVSRYEIIHTATIDDHKYKIRPAWYNELKEGQEVIFVQDPSEQYSFPLYAIQHTAHSKRVVLWLIPIWVHIFIQFIVGVGKWITSF